MSRTNALRCLSLGLVALGMFAVALPKSSMAAEGRTRHFYGVNVIRTVAQVAPAPVAPAPISPAPDAPAPVDPTPDCSGPVAPAPIITRPPVNEAQAANIADGWYRRYQGDYGAPNPGTVVQWYPVNPPYRHVPCFGGPSASFYPGGRYGRWDANGNWGNWDQGYLGYNGYTGW